MSYNDYPVGVIRMAAGGTVGVAGQGLRIYSVLLKGTTVSATNVTFFAGNSAVSTASELIYLALSGANPTFNTFDSHCGILFTGGCFMVTSTTMAYAAISCKQELF
jgi:hypothetical protein